MPSALDQYRAAKSDYIKLRSQAKKELIARFHELANDLLRIQSELLEDFGTKVQLPSKPKRSGKSKPPLPVKSNAAENARKDVGQISSIQKKLELQRKKLADAKAAGKSTKPAEDRIYELEDELRLAQNS